MAPCSEPSSGWAIASPSRHPELAGGRSPLDFNPDIKSADAALQRINRAASGGPTCTRDDIFDCFERIHRATEHLVDGVEYDRDRDVRSEPELYSHTRSREQMRDDSDLVAMINVSQDILRTLCYVRDCNTSRQRQQQLLLQETNHRHHRSSSDHQHLQEPMSPRQSIARGQKRKQEEQQQRGVSRKKKSPRAQATYCRQCSATGSVKWRSGPDGLRTLCNVCGLLYAKRLRRFQLL